jgi:hypothetical protein
MALDYRNSCLQRQPVHSKVVPLQQQVVLLQEDRVVVSQAVPQAVEVAVALEALLELAMALEFVQLK